ncbi:MAG: class I SAM-dependent methyltransferase [Deltaproteobacteria bacterium]|nr:class I SAM-dependent methyltransferase [Deltaproteobacteria bacterium]
MRKTKDPIDFPDWESLYRNERTETMPWYYPPLDPDLESALQELGKKGAALDIGTGPGTQASALALLGFRVTATDLSATAVGNAAKEAKKRGLEIAFIEDDILHTRLTERFDLIFDRGCFHTLPPKRRKDYVSAVSGLLREGGFLFLKAFSHLERMKGGPYRFKKEDIRRLFEGKFDLLSIEDTVFHGTLTPFPKALFCVLKKTGRG